MLLDLKLRLAYRTWLMSLIFGSYYSILMLSSIVLMLLNFLLIYVLLYD